MPTASPEGLPGPAASGEEDEAEAPAEALPPRPVEPDPRPGGIRITRAMDLAFEYDPARERGPVLVSNAAGEPVVISLHGPHAARSTINGQPAVEGRRYLLRDACEVQGPGPVGIHVRRPRPQDRPAQPERDG